MMWIVGAVAAFLAYKVVTSKKVPQSAATGTVDTSSLFALAAGSSSGGGDQSSSAAWANAAANLGATGLGMMASGLGGGAAPPTVSPQDFGSIPTDYSGFGGAFDGGGDGGLGF